MKLGVIEFKWIICGSKTHDWRLLGGNWWKEG